MAKDFDISKATGLCHRTGQPIEPNQEFVALVRMAGEELTREDYSLAAWAEIEPENPAEADDVLGVWRTHMPAAEEKKKLLVDDSVLLNFFERLEGTDDPARIDFRYVLTLILMRKRYLSYEGSATNPDGTETWTMRRRGTDNHYQVTDPKLSTDRITEVSASLGAIMEGDFDE